MSYVQKNLYAEVILPLYLPQLYTYKIPEELISTATVGKRVLVQLGKHKIYSAIIHKITNEVPAFIEIKNIQSVLDEYPVVSNEQFRLWEWIADYYLCTLGEVMAAALPSALKLHSETSIVLNPELNDNFLYLTEQEYAVTESLQDKKSLSLKEISKLIDRKNAFPVVKSLMDKGLVLVKEEVHEKFKPKLITYVRKTDLAHNEEFMHNLFEQMQARAAKQLDLLMHFLKLEHDLGEKRITQNDLLKVSGSTSNVLQQLVKKNILTLVKEKEEKYFDAKVLLPKQNLNVAQAKALDEITALFSEKDVVLLHGITSSGKTEIYIHLIEECVKQGKQVLYLVPEIALTTQIISRLKKYFGENLFVYHSKFNETERATTYTKLIEINQLKNNKNSLPPIVIGARSAVFLPYTNLGLVIVDEEHEPSYKQYDPAPRYHARDTSIVLAKNAGAKVLLGTATPSLESYYNSQNGKFGLVELNTRYGETELPEIKIVNVKELMLRKQMKSHFAPIMLDTAQQELDNRKQVIFFQNRKGFAPIIECNNCGWIPHCLYCDVALTYYKKSDLLKCHYCGYTTQSPARCKACGDYDLRQRGFGTEKIEDELQIFFPDKKIARLDMDTTRSRHAYREIISGFERGETDILVGTQMVTKGLDFENVSLVGILNADNLINFPDFRSYERSFQMMLQVSGRAGRKHDQGKVIIQTYNPAHSIFPFVLSHDYKGFYASEIAERKRFSYPPFHRLIEIKLKLRDEKKLELATEALTKELKKNFGKRVLGPVAPYVARIKNFYIRHILIKIEKELSIGKAKKLMNNSLEKFKIDSANRQLIISIDVDPQ
jgi:primosomal protein N' (replication factor Y)